MRFLTVMLAASAFALALAPCAHSADVILNEYNAVKDSGILKDGGVDSYFGSIPGNGGDWMEFVIITDNLDIRNWKIVTQQSGAADATITLPDVPALASLRSGTILTISESQPTDWSYAPAYSAADPNGTGDWWINYQASFSAGDNTHKDFNVTILNALDALVFGPAGEGIASGAGIGSDEVFKLEENPSAAVTNLSTYNDGTSSTYGSPNKWSSGTVTQDFGPLRSVVPEPASLTVLAAGLALLKLRRK